MMLEVLKDYKGIPKGSVLDVIRENKLSYRTLWSSMGGSYIVTVPKAITRELTI